MTSWILNTPVMRQGKSSKMTTIGSFKTGSPFLRN